MSAMEVNHRTQVSQQDYLNYPAVSLRGMENENVGESCDLEILTYYNTDHSISICYHYIIAL
jgi:hypothetical protein